MHGFANPTRFVAIARPLTPFLFWVGAALVGWALYQGVFNAPAEKLQGDTVRIIYLHVPSAWLGMAGWISIAIASLVELVWRHPLAGVAARASALPGAMFTAICLVTGSIWAKPTWGTWWVWDARLTSMLVLFFLYLGYIALADASQKEAAQGRSGTARVAAIFGLVGAINVPIINRSVEWFSTQHQSASITLGKSAIDSVFLMPLLIAAIGFSMIFAAIVLMRMRTLLAEIRIEARMRRLAAA